LLPGMNLVLLEKRSGQNEFSLRRNRGFHVNEGAF
jgi:hypothetical protein